MPSVSLTKLIHLARSGIFAHQLGLDVTANNISNVNTVGYKRSRAEFHELLNAELETPPLGSSRELGQGAGTRPADIQRLFNQGSIQRSERPWDMAIAGEGFFQVILPDGSLAYTRDGSFRLDGEGNLTHAKGYLMSPALTIPPDAEETFILDGVVMARRRGETEPEAIGEITLARFTNPAGLEKIGENLYQTSEASGEAQVSRSGQNGTGQIISQALEESNVDLSEEIVNLISAQRAYSLMLQALQTSDEMFGLATQMR